MKKFTRSYEVLNRKSDEDRHWQIAVQATPDELAGFARTGYLVREGLFEGTALERLRDALDRLEAREWPPYDAAAGHADERSWGRIPRHLMDKDPAFLELLKFPPVLSVARAMMGPLLRLRGLSARISYPGGPTHETPWHQHMRVIPQPLPPWFSRPHCIDALIYLDDLDQSTGPVCVVPGSHDWLDREPPSGSYEPVDGELELCVKAGGAVMIHGNLWHRGLPTRSKKRRMLILSYTPTWLRKSPHGGPPPTDGLTQKLLETADEETRMLLGIGGYS